MLQRRDNVVVTASLWIRKRKPPPQKIDLSQMHYYKPICLSSGRWSDNGTSSTSLIFRVFLLCLRFPTGSKQSLENGPVLLNNLFLYFFIFPVKVRVCEQGLIVRFG